MYPLLFGPVDAVLAPVIEWVLLGLVAVNLVTRHHLHRTHRRALESAGADAIRHTRLHMASNLLLVLVTFYFYTLHLHYGTIVSVLVVGLVLTDFFEIESRRVEARTDEPLDLPKAAITLSAILLLYVGYVALYFVIEPLVRVII